MSYLYRFSWTLCHRCRRIQESCETKAPASAKCKVFSNVLKLKMVRQLGQLLMLLLFTSCGVIIATTLLTDVSDRYAAQLLNSDNHQVSHVNLHVHVTVCKQIRCPNHIPPVSEVIKFRFLMFDSAETNDEIVRGHLGFRTTDMSLGEFITRGSCTDHTADYSLDKQTLMGIQYLCYDQDSHGWTCNVIRRWSPFLICVTTINLRYLRLRSFWASA